MRKFRLKVWCEDYEPLKKNEVYDSDFIPNGWSVSIGMLAERFPEEWEEVL